MATLYVSGVPSGQGPTCDPISLCSVRALGARGDGWPSPSDRYGGSPVQPPDSHIPPDQEVVQEREPTQDPLVPGLSSSSSPHEALAGAYSFGLLLIGLGAHQDLPRRVVFTMNLQVVTIPPMGSGVECVCMVSSRGDGYL